MKILVIGGSYFLGRWFVQLAYKEHGITVLNRGNIPIGLSGVSEIVADRHNDIELCKLKSEEGRFDAVVDFCAYNAGDIKLILDHLEGAMPERYIYISTVDVYKKGSGAVLDESAELTDITGAEKTASLQRVNPADAETEYIKGKTELEHELVSVCKAYGIKGISVRPVILYGPGNYAPRESVYFEWIKRAGQIIHPVDADGFFQMMYVADAARGILRLCEIPVDEIREAYNFCTDEILTYDKFEMALEKAFRLYDSEISGDEVFTKINVSADKVIEQGIPLPFPLTATESEIYSGVGFGGLDVKVTPLEEGLYACLKVG